MKTLNIIQRLCKIAKIFSKIVYVCCIVGFVGCVVGAVAMAFGVHMAEIKGFSLKSILQNEAGVAEGTIWAAIAVGAVLCVGEFFVARKAYAYFANELLEGTPFTMTGAKELLRLGISAVWIPVASVLSAQIVQAIIAQFFEGVESIALDSFESIATGIMLIVCSLLCRYGAELRDEKRESATEIES